MKAYFVYFIITLFFIPSINAAGYDAVHTSIVQESSHSEHIKHQHSNNNSEHSDCHKTQITESNHDCCDEKNPTSALLNLDLSFDKSFNKNYENNCDNSCENCSENIHICSLAILANNTFTLGKIRFDISSHTYQLPSPPSNKEIIPPIS